MSKRFAFIMAGGTGERFWPLSRADRPKQLLRLASPTESLLEEAVHRVAPIFGTTGVFVITNPNLLEPIAASNVLPRSHIWAEPQKKNTLGALVWVTAKLMAQGHGDASLAILTADHRIGDANAFRATVTLALETAEATGGLVTCGIAPSRAETGYGYIEPDRTESVGASVFRAKSFREKPDSDTAARYIEDGYLWNSGMFFWTINAFSVQLQRAQPQTYEILEQITGHLASNRLDMADEAFAQLPNISIDFALMESADNVHVVAANFGWDDIGAWDALPRTMGVDGAGNTAVGRAISIDSEQCVLYNASSKALLTTIGVENLIVVVTDEAVLICSKDQAQRVKEMVEAIKSDPEAPL